MIVPNATITSYRRCTGKAGDGTPVLGAELATRPIRCRAVDPGGQAKVDARSAGIELDRLVMVQPSALTSLNIEPRADDRIAVKNNTESAATAFIVIDVTRGGAACGGPIGAVGAVTLRLRRAA